MNISKVDGMQIEKYNQTDRQQGLVSRFCEGHIGPMSRFSTS